MDTTVLAVIGSVIDWLMMHETLLSGLAAATGMTVLATTLCYRMLTTTGSRLRQVTQRRDQTNLTQQLRYCATADGVRIAYAKTGNLHQGIPLVRALGWFTHLQAEWQPGAGRALWQRLSRRHCLYRYDGRGMGLSSAVDSRFTMEERLRDLEAVIDAAGLDRCALIGLSEGGATAIAYAAKHPDRVSHLILYGSFLNTASFDVETRARWEQLLPLMRQAWRSERPAIRQLFTGIMIPDADAAQNAYFNELQRLACDGTTAFRMALAVANIDVSNLAPAVQAPTLVLHRRGDLAIPVEAGQALAASIPNAELVLLEGANHWMLMAEPDTDRIVSRMEAFLSGGVID